MSEEAVQYADNRSATYLQALGFFLVASVLVEVEVLALGRANFTFFALGIIPIYFLAPIVLTLLRINRLRGRIFFMLFSNPEINERQLDERKLEALVYRIHKAADQVLILLALGWAMLFGLFLFFTFVFGR